ncbi:hypothetical protein LUZ60_003649 [Juncus effusus]|nr:hypothetical protein LUZ60_003649 [Juncus effusus]
MEKVSTATAVNITSTEGSPTPTDAPIEMTKNSNTSTDNTTQTRVKTLRGHATPDAGLVRSSIKAPTVGVNNFDLKPALLSIIQQNQLGGSLTEDPKLYLQIILDYCDTLQLNDVNFGTIRLKLFPFTLRDRA